MTVIPLPSTGWTCDQLKLPPLPNAARIEDRNNEGN